MDLPGGLYGTPVMVAAAMGRLQVVQILIDSGSPTSCFVDGRHVNFLEHARHFSDIIRWLMDGRWTRTRFID